MDKKVKTCECKGIRSCLLCEDLLAKKARNFHEEFQKLDSFVYCMKCQKIFRGWNCFNDCGDHKGLEGLDFSGIFIQEDFLSVDEAKKLVDGVDSDLGWDASQSGRRKKNYGPKVNFKKKRLVTGAFAGFPKVTEFLRHKLREVDLLKDFETIEECYLEYDPSRGSHIDPHIDDCWVWGERVVTVNCLGDSVLTLNKHSPLYPKHYNIDLVEDYKNSLISPLVEEVPDNILVRIPMPENSLLVLTGPTRYQYEHSVLREDITSRRVAIAYREFTIPYLKGGSKYHEAEEVFKLSQMTL